MLSVKGDSKLCKCILPDLLGVEAINQNLHLLASEDSIIHLPVLSNFVFDLVSGVRQNLGQEFNIQL